MFVYAYKPTSDTYTYLCGRENCTPAIHFGSFVCKSNTYWIATEPCFCGCSLFPCRALCVCDRVGMRQMVMAVAARWFATHATPCKWTNGRTQMALNLTSHGYLRSIDSETNTDSIPMIKWERPLWMLFAISRWYRLCHGHVAWLERIRRIQIKNATS